MHAPTNTILSHILARFPVKIYCLSSGLSLPFSDMLGIILTNNQKHFLRYVQIYKNNFLK